MSGEEAKQYGSGHAEWGRRSAEAEAKEARPPTMQRSRSQIATAYAPGVLLTWEGGRGICKSVPIRNDLKDSLTVTTAQMIFDGIGETTDSWMKRARDACPDAPPEFCLDAAFMDIHSGDAVIDSSRFVMTKPDVVGYVPYPLLYQCAECKSVREFRNVAEQAVSGMPQCKGHVSRWMQVDVVYAHWYGTIEPLSPYNYSFDDEDQKVNPLRSCGCGWPHFRLRNDAPVFNEWKYSCESCGDVRDLKKAEPKVLAKLSIDKQRAGTDFEFIQVNMLPVSYRASSAFYPQRANFIELKNGAVVDLMREQRQEDLLRELARLHRIPFEEPTEDAVKAAVEAAGLAAEWQEYSEFLDLMQRRQARGDDTSRQVRAIEEIRAKWFADGIIEKGTVSSSAIARAVVTRRDWTRKYDPIRLTIEHAAFVDEHIRGGLEAKKAVDVMYPDVTLSSAAGIKAEIAKYQKAVGDVLDKTGVERMVILRGLPICDYSFGFTRVSATPVYNREYQNRNVPMPVRLVGFDPFDDGKRPIYVTQQNNEALYVKLDEGRVRRWLVANGVDGVPSDDVRLGRAYLESYEDFGPFLDDFKDKERQGRERKLAPFVYMLLHSLSHQLIHSLADASGLDRDGIGEYLFPADLAFTIYRKGMTPDLGNISAMWRNHAMNFLQRSVETRMLRCGSGSLCDSRGGACPACIMTSEVSCASSNLLLSRSALKGGGRPEWEASDMPDLVGYFQRRLDDSST
ncbi:hypothetical protein [Rhizobium leguminosarum]|uniref:hypothetical protein n=1 Tax=Rhizobium leguminosarum TaxID=384 RepID=UPI000371BE25|nr:hypothetical protein [Rhizobium leguminosarum]